MLNVRLSAVLLTLVVGVTSVVVATKTTANPNHNSNNVIKKADFCSDKGSLKRSPKKKLF
jgi:hypothetical protein